MRRIRLLGFIAGVTMLGTVAAQAAPGFSTANVNIRTGPDIDFPSVGVIPEGDDLDIRGCLRDESWCDVIWAGNRGWVFSEYLAFEQRGGGYVSLPDVGPAAFAIPFVTFAARDYWDRHYVGRPWYRDRSRWYDYRVRPRAGWRAPPPGKRNPGWWRKDYRAPPGYRAPPSDYRNWKRPHRDRRDDRRGDHRGGDHRGGDHRGGDHRGGDHRGGDHRGGDHRGGDYRGPDRR